ncbi:Uracil-DNA glycosylase [Cellulophaga lytica DSM 7489]|uniref:Uracil-DNA glycosylase n=1 Tax=Cellulophaga lytica (strain ATCC 23178 / DSM 7489 / JCM 8516 / NBRC 14961 / NCIMB 1423 / VKM B-1433 / Cy l20) TaxID=867900 RepID=F0RC81_CELLC|nr:uracil-DNA glycosylase [Cellulophaga lytica]ADY30745.1 Uracil-DNA glycosylase [Cellulophaga lytica DSM 7489]WQG78331.1 uracil-DNA glycosylase [Cellulophaga lytica]
MKANVSKSWSPIILPEFKKEYFKELTAFVTKEYNTNTCFPATEDIFAAFNYSSFNTTKIVIIGQDPYHGPNQANGLCFSVKDGIKHPPSLINIFKELESDLNIPYPKSGNLERWAKQGVLLLNATLTVRAHEAGSHQKKGWETFTDTIIKKISDEKEGVIFLLWGGFAKKKAKLIDTKKHHILTSGHPSPLSANRGYWFGNKHFSTANTILKDSGKTLIEW